ncbi:RICIN domain-containing protein [Gynuella sunshinyii]|uniref:Poly(3-hydroxybutyrate) depolymerase n=1 Tax=Gynuella sunshinyii YC6258 TaxID=1445510 RepID=A0A0C5V0M3_9GAMM|nr:RICIN domain-containing protein [Gynuella sunshinyii]AJQ93105.1 poly(3-hydroxybutyrate) depolymerase [Gynuella sunshinyii YC6258]
MLFSGCNVDITSGDQSDSGNDQNHSDQSNDNGNNDASNDTGGSSGSGSAGSGGEGGQGGSDTGNDNGDNGNDTGTGDNNNTGGDTGSGGEGDQGGSDTGNDNGDNGDDTGTGDNNNTGGDTGNGGSTGNDGNGGSGDNTETPDITGRYNIVSSLSGLYMDVAEKSTDNGANILQFSYTGANNQKFDIKLMDDGSYSIRAVHSGKSLDVYNYSTEDGAELLQWTFNATDNQRWHIDNVGNDLYSITSVLSNKVVSVWQNNTEAGGDIRMNTWKGESGQKWSLVPVSVDDGSYEPPVGTDSSAGCGVTTSLSSGRHSMDVNGQKREYILDIPGNYDSNKPYRLIFGWHWLGGSADNVANGAYYGLKDLSNGSAIFVAADRYVSPNGEDDNGWPNTNGRDMNFLRAMLEQFENELCVDKNRIFSVGWSYGGMMSFAVGHEMAGVFRAIAPMSGALWTPYSDSGKPMAAWIAHGIYDDFVGYDNGVAAKDSYVAANHCSNTTLPVEPSPCVEYQGCDAGYPVVWCPWSGGHSTPPFQSSAIWTFFSQF